MRITNHRIMVLRAIQSRMVLDKILGMMRVARCYIRTDPNQLKNVLHHRITMLTWLLCLCQKYAVYYAHSICAWLSVAPHHLTLRNVYPPYTASGILLAIKRVVIHADENSNQHF